MPYLGRMSTQPSGVIPEFTMADRLRKARETTGMDQGAFAKTLGISRNSVSNAETGATHPIRLIIEAWSRETGVPIRWLTTGEVPQGPNDWGEVPTGAYGLRLIAA